MRAATWLGIVAGGAAGAVAAFAAAPAEESESPPPELAPVAALPISAARPAPAPSPAASPAQVVATASATPKDKPSASAGAASRDELTRLEVGCQEKKDPLLCRAAAQAYEQGGVVPADPARARLFRKIELTFLVKQCEAATAQACILLAERYEQGDGVAQNPTNAQALRDRAKDLCASKPTPGCDALH